MTSYINCAECCKLEAKLQHVLSLSSSMALGIEMTACWSVRHFCPDWNVSATIEWIAMKSCMNESYWLWWPPDFTCGASSRLTFVMCVFRVKCLERYGMNWHEMCCWHSWSQQDKLLQLWWFLHFSSASINLSIMTNYLQNILISLSWFSAN